MKLISPVRWVLVHMAATMAAACAASTLGPVGSSAPRAAEPLGPSSEGPDAGAAPPAPVPSTFRTFMSRLGQFHSSGHGDRFDATLWANPKAQSAWQEQTAMPEGALLVEELTVEEEGSPRPAGLLAMEKRQGTWKFNAIGPGGDVAAPARVAPCASCHDQAPDDDVFRR